MTALGWVVSGPLRQEKTDNDITQSHTVNRLAAVKIDELLHQWYNVDFPEFGYEEKEDISQENHRFMSLICICH